MCMQTLNSQFFTIGLFVLLIINGCKPVKTNNEFGEENFNVDLSVQQNEEAKLTNSIVKNNDENDFLIFEGTSFISLSPISGKGFEKSIAQMYLDSLYNEDNDHILKPENRKTFLSSCNIEESDTLYSYDFYNDVVIKNAIAQLQVHAVLSPYGEPYNNPRSYYIGLNVPDLNSKWGCFSYIGKSNPFNTGSWNHLIWTEIESDELPEIETQYDTVQLEAGKKLLCYFSEQSGFKFYYVKLGKGNSHLLVLNSADNHAVYNRIISNYIEDYVHMDTEGAKRYEMVHWVGQLFKNKPIAVYGFSPAMFGCTELQFLDKNEPDLEIICDNRH